MKTRINVDSAMLSVLQGEQRELAELVGLEVYLNLVKIYGGTTIYIAKMDKLQNIKRDIEIYKQFTGYNYHQLAKKYCLTERRIREIISKMKNFSKTS